MALNFLAVRNGECPRNAVMAGKDDDGCDLAVGRAPHKGGMCPGKLNPNHPHMYISWGGKEIAVAEYEILVQEGDNVHWVAACDGQLPSGVAPVKTGHEANGDPLFVARGKVNTSLSVGKMNPKFGLAYLPYGGEVRKIMKPIPALEHLILWKLCFRSTKCLSTRCFA